MPTDRHPSALAGISADEWVRIMRTPTDTREAVERTGAAVRQSRELVAATRRGLDAGPCPTCGHTAAVLFYPVRPMPGEGQDPSLVCPACYSDAPMEG